MKLGEGDSRERVAAGELEVSFLITLIFILFISFPFVCSAFVCRFGCG